MHFLSKPALLNACPPRMTYFNCPTPRFWKYSPILENRNFESVLQTKHFKKEPSQRWKCLLRHQIKGKKWILYVCTVF